MLYILHLMRKIHFKRFIFRESGKLYL